MKLQVNKISAVDYASTGRQIFNDIMRQYIHG